MHYSMCYVEFMHLLQWCMERPSLYQETQQVLLMALNTRLQVPRTVLIVSMFPGMVLTHVNWQSPSKSLGKLQGTA